MLDTSLEKRLAVLEAIAHLHHSVGANLDLGKVSQILVEELCKIVHCSGCAVMRVEGRQVAVLAECGFAQAMGGGAFTVEMPAISYIVSTRQSILSGNITESPAAACVPSGCTMNSLICAPIKVAGEVQGIIHLDSPEVSAFNEEDLALVELLASEISIVFERSLDYYRVRSQSLRDRLTGSLNRRAFEDDLAEALAEMQTTCQSLALILADIDWFKAYNDKHGHPMGDDALSDVAATLRGNVRGNDRVYRYGGEEFAVLLPRTTAKQARQVAQRLRKAIERYHFPGAELSQPNGRLTMSFGVAEFPCDGLERRALLRAADEALYEAKRLGRNRVAGVCRGPATQSTT